MVRIPAGKFVMGSPEGEAQRFEDETQRAVTITKPFYMSAFEVTQKQFYKLTIPDYDLESWTYFRGPIANGAAYHFRTSAGSFGRGLDLLLDNPMECVAWPKALAYCELINKREQAAGEWAAVFLIRFVEQRGHGGAYVFFGHRTQQGGLEKLGIGERIGGGHFSYGGSGDAGGQFADGAGKLQADFGVGIGAGL